jgi:hypothetical protein
MDRLRGRRDSGQAKRCSQVAASPRIGALVKAKAVFFGAAMVRSLLMQGFLLSVFAYNSRYAIQHYLSFIFITLYHLPLDFVVALD